MNDLTIRAEQLPETIEQKAEYVLFGTDALKAYRAKLSAVKKRFGILPEQYKQLEREAQETAENVLLFSVDVGEHIASLPKDTSFHGNQHKEVTRPIGQNTRAEAIGGLGFTERQARDLQTIAAHPDIVQNVIEEARQSGDVASRSAVIKKVKAKRKAEAIEEAKEKAAKEVAEQPYPPVIQIGDGIGFEPGVKYDLLLTDPPYSTDVDNIGSFAHSWLPNALRYVKDTGFAYVFIGAYPDELRAYLNIAPPENVELTQLLIWTYKNTLGNNPANRYKQNYQACLFYRGVNAPKLNCPQTSEQWAVQEINAPDGRQGDREHAWQKPMEIAERFIRHTTKQGQIVFDPFACTGTFLLAAAKLGRKAYGFEINPENAKIAERRGCLVNGVE